MTNTPCGPECDWSHPPMRPVTLTEFLLARIAEDEAVARAASDALFDDEDWQVDRDRDVLTERGGALVATAAKSRAPLAEHIARHDPARVLAECQAKRAVVAVCWTPDPHTQPEAANGKCTECAVLYSLAQTYADHPDYDEAWRP